MEDAEGNTNRNSAMSQPKDRKHDDQNPRILKTVQPPPPTNPKPLKDTSGPDGDVKTTQKPSFADRCRTSRFWLVRALYKVVSSIWMVVMVVGGFIAWLIAMLFI